MPGTLIWLTFALAVVLLELERLARRVHTEQSHFLKGGSFECIFAQDPGRAIGHNGRSVWCRFPLGLLQSDYANCRAEASRCGTDNNSTTYRSERANRADKCRDPYGHVGRRNPSRDLFPDQRAAILNGRPNAGGDSHVNEHEHTASIAAQPINRQAGHSQLVRMEIAGELFVELGARTPAG